MVANRIGNFSASGNAGQGGCLRSSRLIGNEIDKRNQFREQSVPTISQIEVQEIETAHQSVVSPCRSPLSDTPNSLPCISEHCITYSPTLGLVQHLLDAGPKAKSDHGIDVHVSEFFSNDQQRERDLRDDLAAQERQVVDLTGKSALNPPSHFFRIASASIHTYAAMSWENMAPASMEGNSTQSNIRSWSLLPWGAPSSMVLAGVDAVGPVPNSRGDYPSGDDWLRVTLPLIAQGTRQLTLSRWPVGGESTASLMRSFQDNQVDLSISESWQRSVLTLWEDNFEQRREPVFHGSPSTNTEDTVSGSHPLLWSGYIRIGDSK